MSEQSIIQKLNRLHELIISLTQLGDIGNIKIEAETIIRSIQEEVLLLNPFPSNLNMKITSTLLDAVAKKKQEMSKKLARLNSEFRTGRYRSALKIVEDVMGDIGYLSTLSGFGGSKVVPPKGFVSGVHTTDVTTMCGPVASTIYGWLLSVGRASIDAFSLFIKHRGIDETEASRAIQCLINQGLVETENFGGMLYYVPKIH